MVLPAVATPDKLSMGATTPPEPASTEADTAVLDHETSDLEPAGAHLIQPEPGAIDDPS